MLQWREKGRAVGSTERQPCRERGAVQLLIAAIADHANLELHGKLNLLGVFDNINSQRFPARHPQLCVVLRVLYEYDDVRLPERRFDVKLLDQDGQESVRATGEIQLEPIPAGGHRAVNHILWFNDLVFSRPNEFVFVIDWNGQEVRRLPLTVRLIQAGPTG